MIQLAIWLLAAFVCGVAFLCVWSVITAVIKAVIADTCKPWTTTVSPTVKKASAPDPHTSPQPRLGRSLILRLHTLRAKRPIMFPRNPYPLNASPTASAVQDLLARPGAADTH